MDNKRYARLIEMAYNIERELKKEESKCGKELKRLGYLEYPYNLIYLN